MNLKTSDPMSDKAWWQKPGLGIMYQIEFRPGWKWNRNFNKFNRTMTDKKGKFNFNGPYCQMAEWVNLSRQIGVDYHIFEVKWHDGIVWFNTSLTDWKTPTDYARQFADGSRQAGIPFMFYYSQLFDHNPQFRSIVPMNFVTPGPPKMGNGSYKKYLEGQMREIIDQYNPDGIWLDWYTMGLHSSENVAVDLLHQYSPNTIVTSNLTNQIAEERLRFPRRHPDRGNFLEILRTLLHVMSDRHIPLMVLGTLGLYLTWLQQKVFDSRDRGRDILDLLHYTTSEAHNRGGAWIEANLHRRLRKPWELLAPAGRRWDLVTIRKDLYDLVRMAAITMANGGRFVIGAASEMDGSLYPDHVLQLRLVGEWYKPRRNLFSEAIPMGYGGTRVPGVSGYQDGMSTVGSRLGHDYLLHLINFRGNTDYQTLRFNSRIWPQIDKVYLEPAHKELTIEGASGEMHVTISKKDVDLADTQLRIICSV